jgi:ATP-dependent RNA helicase DeaD
MKNFKDLNISEPVLRAILELGYDSPTPIQAETLPLLLGNDTDFLGLAATGTGKTVNIINEL